MSTNRLNDLRVWKFFYKYLIINNLFINKNYNYFDFFELNNASYLFLLVFHKRYGNKTVERDIMRKTAQSYYQN